MDTETPEQLSLGNDLDSRAPELPEGRDFIKLEKNLSSLGFFSPTTKNVKKDMKPKCIGFMATVDGNHVEASVTINPSVIDGLPTTAHQDKTFAFYKLVNDRRRFGERIENPIGFHSIELLRLLGIRKSGRNYQEVDEWLSVMTSTTIVSEGAVYHADTKSFGKDRYHVFERSISFGKRLPDGNLADKNYVWLSEWQLENINSNYFLPVDFEAYKKLRNHTAKALVPLLQVWLYASQGQGMFAKSYSDLCQHLNLQSYRYLSQIRQKLSPALDELAAAGYLASWEIERTVDEEGFKVIFEHGPKFFEDKAIRAEQKPRRRRKMSSKAASLPVSAPSLLPINEQSAAERLVRAFHQAFYQRGESIDPLPKELERAGTLIAKYGFERASSVVPFAVKRLKENKSYHPDTFGGIAQYVSEAVANFDREKALALKQTEKVERRYAAEALRLAQEAAKAVEVDKSIARLQIEAPAAFQGFLGFIEAEKAKALNKPFIKPGSRAEQILSQSFANQDKRRELFHAWQRAQGEGSR